MLVQLTHTVPALSWGAMSSAVVEILAPHAGGQAVARVIGDLHRLGRGAEGHQHHDGPKISTWAMVAAGVTSVNRWAG
jgi:hypothetical protein